MGSRKTPGSGTFPLLRTLPLNSQLFLTSSLQITQGGDPVCLYCRENLLFPHSWRMTGPYCFHLFTPPLPWLLSVLALNRIWWILFFLFFCFLFGKFCFYSLHSLHCSSTTRGIVWQSAVAIFKCGTDGWAFLIYITWTQWWKIKF